MYVTILREVIHYFIYLWEYIIGFVIEKFELCDRDSIFGYKHVKDNFITNDRIIGFKIYDFLSHFI